MTDPTAQPGLFPGLFGQSTPAVFDGAAQSTEGGAGTLRAADDRSYGAHAARMHNERPFP